MLRLNESFLRAAIVGLRVGRSDGDADEAAYGDLFVARTGFYDNVSEAVRGAWRVR